jgi:hypothetical protein
MSIRSEGSSEDNCVRGPRGGLGGLGGLGGGGGLKSLNIEKKSSSSEELFERGSGVDFEVYNDGDSTLGFANNEEEDYLKQYKKCKKATVERVQPYQDLVPVTFGTLFVNVEGPEYILDYSYWAVHWCPLIAELEKGI